MDTCMPCLSVIAHPGTATHSNRHHPCAHLLAMSLATFNNIVVTSACLLQEWETESVVLERVSLIWVIEQA